MSLTTLMSRMSAGAQVAGSSVKQAWLKRLKGRTPVTPATSATTQSRQIYILPTRAGLGYAAVLLAMLLGSLNYQNNLALFLTFVMISAAVVSMHHCWFHLLKLRLSAGDGAAVFRGQTALFPLRLDERGGRARSAICVDGGGCVDVPALGHAALQVRRPTRKRGELALGAIDLETRYPFGLFRAWTRLPLYATVLVYPAPAARAPAPGTVDASEHRGNRDLGIGSDDYMGPRNYQRGDSPHRVDWKALARERGLVVKQFGGDRAARVLLDWRQVWAQDTESRLSLLARQVLDAHQRGLSYGLWLPGLELKPDRGEGHKHQCLAALARYRGDG